MIDTSTAAGFATVIVVRTIAINRGVGNVEHTVVAVKVDCTTITAMGQIRRNGTVSNIYRSFIAVDIESAAIPGGVLTASSIIAL